MNILVINKFLFPRAGDVISALNTARLLAEHGHQVTLWGMAHERNPGYEYQELFATFIDFNVRDSFFNNIGKACNVIYSLSARKKLDELLKRVRPDVAHLHSFHHHLSPSILHTLRQHRVPLVATLHDFKMVCPAYTLFSNNRPCELCGFGNYYNCFLHKCVKNSYSKSLVNVVETYLHKKVFHSYDSIKVFISPSRFLMEKCRQMGFSADIVHIANFVYQEAAVSDKPINKGCIAYVGRLSREKGLLTLLDAVKGVTGVFLKIIGDGPQRRELESKVGKENIGNVKFFGHCDSLTLKKELAECAFTVLPSLWYENCPNSVLESFSLGKPVVGADIGGIPELIEQEETGLLFQSGNAADLREKIIYLIGREALVEKMRQEILRRVGKDYGPEKHYEKLMQLYAKILS